MHQILVEHYFCNSLIYKIMSYCHIHPTFVFVLYAYVSFRIILNRCFKYLAFFYPKWTSHFGLLPTITIFSVPNSNYSPQCLSSKHLNFYAPRNQLIATSKCFTMNVIHQCRCSFQDQQIVNTVVPWFWNGIRCAT